MLLNGRKNQTNLCHSLWHTIMHLAANQLCGARGHTSTNCTNTSACKQTNAREKSNTTTKHHKHVCIIICHGFLDFENNRNQTFQQLSNKDVHLSILLNMLSKQRGHNYAHAILRNHKDVHHAVG